MRLELGAFDKAEATRVSLLRESACFQNWVSLQTWRGGCRGSKRTPTKAGVNPHAVAGLETRQSELRPSELPAPQVVFQSNYNMEQEPRKIWTTRRFLILESLLEHTLTGHDANAWGKGSHPGDCWTSLPA